MLKNISFRNQLGIIFSLGMLLLALVCSIVISELTSQKLRERLVGEGLKLTESFAEQSTLALLYSSEDSALEAAAVIKAFPDIEAVEIRDIGDRVLYSDIPADFSQVSHSPALALFGETPLAWYFDSPVYSGGAAESPFTVLRGAPELIGHVRVTMSKATLNNMESSIFRYNLLVSMVLASILLLVLLTVTGRLTRPLQNLAKTMRKAEQGENAIRAELRGTSDIRDMESAFNTMMDVLDGREEALKLARDQALESARAKGEFAANVSHELRTPMNGVLGMLDLLSDMRLGEKQKEFVGIARSSAESLLSLIDDLLDFSKNEAGKAQLSLREFDLYECLEEIVVLLGSQAQRKSIDFAYVAAAEIPESLIGDSDRVRQVLVNLAGNAIKFTERGSVGIEVSLSEINADDVNLRFEVWDTGIGIGAEQQERIFEVFSQGDESTTRKFGGTGLGLAISRQLVQLMGGNMGVESGVGEGSRFWFTLPLLRPGGEETSSKSLRVKATQGRMLIVDNNTLVQRSIGCMLDRNQISWDAAAGFEEAQEKLVEASSQQPFTLVLLDEMLDGGRGFELLRYIRSVPVLRQAGVIFVQRNGSHVDSTCENYASAMLTKPVLRNHLVSCINEIQKTGDAAANQRKLLEPSSIMFRGSRLLVVEDDRANQQVALAMLERMGCQADVVNNGKECLAQIARASYDLVLMDCHMPELDGYKATAIIREYEAEDNHVPIIAMTANVTEGESERCLSVGMDDYLAKPLSRESLKEKLLRWLDASGPAEEETWDHIDGFEPEEIVVGARISTTTPISLTSRCCTILRPNSGRR